MGFFVIFLSFHLSSVALTPTLPVLLPPPSCFAPLSLPVQSLHLRMKVIWVWWLCWFCSPWSSSPPSFPSSLSCGKTHAHTHTHVSHIPHPQLWLYKCLSFAKSTIFTFFFFFWCGLLVVPGSGKGGVIMWPCRNSPLWSRWNPCQSNVRHTETRTLFQPF